MKNIILLLIFFPLLAFSQLVPLSTDFNQNIVWQKVFTDGPWKSKSWYSRF